MAAEGGQRGGERSLFSLVGTSLCVSVTKSDPQNPRVEHKNEATEQRDEDKAPFSLTIMYLISHVFGVFCGK